MEDYNEIYESLEEEARENCEDEDGFYDEDSFEDALEEAMRLNVNFEAYELTDVPENTSARELGELVSIEGMETIIEQYKGKKIEF